MMTTLDDLQRGFFWGVLFQLDGPAKGELDGVFNERYDQSLEDPYERKRREAREWTAANFTTPELNDLMKVTVDLALNPPTTEGKPGYIRGHSSLLRHMIDKPGSIFEKGVTREGRIRLVNGAFWEELGDGHAPGRLNDVLGNHSMDLSPEMAIDGILKLYSRNRKLNGGDSPIDMRYFSDHALNAYVRFIKDLDGLKHKQGTVEKPSIDPKIIDELLAPYLSAVLTQDAEDGFYLRFGPKYDFENDTVVTPANEIKERFADDLIQKSLARSEANQELVAQEIAWIFTSAELDGPQGFQVLEAIGGETAKKILAKVLTDKNLSRSSLRNSISDSRSPFAEIAKSMSQRS